MSARNFVQSTVGKKVIMGVTGVFLVLFVCGHVVGNLLVFAGAEAINGYSALLHKSGEVLWVVRAGLLSAAVLHVYSALSLRQASQNAREVAYMRQVPQASTFASRNMFVGGLVLLAFIVFHLLHLTAGVVQPVPLGHDVYRNIVGSFQVPWVAGIYAVSMVVLGLHLFHGAWAWARTLGLARPKPNPLERPVATLLAIGLWVGFTAVPVLILARIVK